MSFHINAEDIEIEDGHILKAKLPDGEGEMKDAEIDLDQHIGNDNGAFQWDGENFSQTAADVEFAIEGDDEVPVLRAKLNDAQGEPLDANINLSERIVNNDGAFDFQ